MIFPALNRLFHNKTPNYTGNSKMFILPTEFGIPTEFGVNLNGIE